MSISTSINISENGILKYGEALLKILLFDRATQRNIIWGTSDYEEYGEEYKAQFSINIHLITGENGNIIQPRIYKEKTSQLRRTKAKAEVFTPSWMCNEQNNLVDTAWFGRNNIFNITSYKRWTATTQPIEFDSQKGKRWTDYVDAKRLEITCGEAPYLVSRYDTVTGEAIPLGSRIGLLDRKMRIVTENTDTYEEWMTWAKRAFESIYGFEYQGDNLLIARENLLYTFIDYYTDKFSEEPSFEELESIAYIISWNIWQMDGLKSTGTFTTVTEQYPLDEGEPEPCFCKIRDWEGKTTEVNKVNFNAVVGNPPYQEADGGASASARPIYPYFVDASKKLNTSYLTIIIPSRWYTGGKHLSEFRQSMLDDVHIRELHDCLHPEEIFPGTNNRGGLCYFLWDSSYNNKSNDQVRIVTHTGGGKTIESIRSMKTRDLDIFVRNSAALSILDKVVPNGRTDVMANHISPRRPFGLDGNFVKTAEFHSSKSGLKEPIKCYGKAKSVGYVEKASIPSHSEWIDCWKVFMPYANNIGTELNDDNQNTFLGEPNSVCTETFLTVGQDDNLGKEQCINLSNYLRTKFARFLLSLTKISQHGTSKTYRFVPVVDFNTEWTDEKLYTHFGLTEEEINLIETSIKLMA